MTVAKPASTVSAPSPWRRFAARAALATLVWLGLNGADWRSWIVGVPAAILAAWVSMRLLPAITWRWSVRGAVLFALFFLRESLRGGWDVARRALAPRLELSPAIMFHPLRLPSGPARLFFCSVINLLPGTAVVAFEESRLCLHVLNRSPRVAADLRDLEDRVAGLFGCNLREERDRMG
mgnify:CR=1 FL=1